MELEPWLLSLTWDGKFEEARKALAGWEAAHLPRQMQPWVGALRDYLDGRCGQKDAPSRETTIEGIVGVLSRLIDPEVFFMLACCMAHLGDRPQTVKYLEASVKGGFSPVQTLTEYSLFEPLRDEPVFVTLLQKVREGREAGLRAFREAGGHALLGFAA
jgi:hypothetical protein